jgi:hypothetical protein
MKDEDAYITPIKHSQSTQGYSSAIYYNKQFNFFLIKLHSTNRIFFTLHN